MIVRAQSHSNVQEESSLGIEKGAPGAVEDAGDDEKVFRL
jgi:hypothetical protein